MGKEILQYISLNNFKGKVKEAFKLELRNIFSALETMNDYNINGNWDNIKDCFSFAATGTQEKYEIRMEKI